MPNALPRTVLPLSVKDLDRVIEVIESLDPRFLPKIRWLFLGPYAASRLLPPGLCTVPSAGEVHQLLDLLDGKGFPQISRVLQHLANSNCQNRVERNLDYLETLPPKKWSHPAQVLDRPWELKYLLELCQGRMAGAGEERRKKLATIIPKIERAIEFEANAARRRKRQGQSQDQPRRRKNT